MSMDSFFSLSNEPSRNPSPMSRYNVKIALDTDPVRSIKLLVPFTPESTLAELTAEVYRRLAKQDASSLSASTVFEIHMSDAEGPLLDAEDRLCDILHGEGLYFAERKQTKVIAHHSALRFQIFTPQFARSGSESKKLIVEVNVNDTIKHLHDKVCDALHIPAPVSGFKVDMHTQEAPIHNSACTTTIGATGLFALAVEGTVPLYVVPRSSALEERSQPVGQGMGDVFLVKDHWHPSQKQSDRGMAMMLSALRVFAQLAKQHKLGERYQAAALSTFAGLSKFPPAVRCLYLLLQGSKPTTSECAALSHSLFEILEITVPEELINNDRGRLFEGARLLFGLVSEKARALAQSDANLIIVLTDFHPVQAHHGLMASAAEIHDDNDRVESDPTLRVCTLSGVQNRSVIVFRGQLDTLPDAIPDLIKDVAYLAELCGQSGLAVWRPTTLASAAAPCLAFDEDGLVCVYTGRVPCALPSRDMGVFRPLHGDETPDMAQVESKLAPFLRKYELEGTDVFDILGSPRSRQLDAPDEILMFCVDVSQSMEHGTAFLDDIPATQDDDLVRLIDVEAFERSTLVKTEAALWTYEGLQDVLEAVKEADQHQQKQIAGKMIQIISIMVLECLETRKMSAEQLDGRSHARLREVRADIERLQVFAAGLRTFSSEIVDLIVLRSEAIEVSGVQYWQVGHGTRQETPGPKPYPLDDDITDIPVHLRCPVSYTALEDPVVAADEQTYSLASISKWFSFRKSSPLTGLPMAHTDLRPHTDLAQEVSRWTQSDDLIAASSSGLSIASDTSSSKRRRTAAADVIAVTFTSPFATFTRTLPRTLSTKDLYKVAFRGMRARHTNFLLMNGSQRIAPIPATTIPTRATRFEILIFPEGQNLSTNADACLVKIFNSKENMAFGFWTNRWTASSLRLVVIKYWRFMLRQNPYMEVVRPAVWSNMCKGGDGWNVGTPHDTETSLSQVLSSVTIKGVLGHESLHDDAANTIDTRIRVFKLFIKEKSDKKRTLSRLEVVQQTFEALVNRMLAYSFMPHIGLVTISTTAQEVQTITHAIERFRDSVNNLEATGDTALWDGLLLAKNRITGYASKFPSAKKRIICLSDGHDTTSTNLPAEVYSQLRKEKITVDCICIGHDVSSELKAISYLLGGYAFKPTDMTTALAICEVEPMLSLLERPEVVTKPWNGLSLHTHFQSATRNATFTQCSKDVIPPRKQHERLGDGVLELTAAMAARRAASSASIGTSSMRSNTRTTRLLSEMQAVAHNPSPQYDVYVSEVDMSFWRVCMRGPSETPYENGSFMLYLDMPLNYPAFPPKARFITRCLHPNVNPHGRICHSIFDRDWTSDTSMTSVLNTIYGLLFQADYSDPVHTIVTLGYHHDQVEFADEVRAHVARYASKSAEHWRREMLGA